METSMPSPLLLLCPPHQTSPRRYPDRPANRPRFPPPPPPPAPPPSPLTHLLLSPREFSSCGMYGVTSCPAYRTREHSSHTARRLPLTVQWDASSITMGITRWRRDTHRARAAAGGTEVNVEAGVLVEGDEAVSLFLVSFVAPARSLGGGGGGGGGLPSPSRMASTSATLNRPHL